MLPPKKIILSKIRENGPETKPENEPENEAANEITNAENEAESILQIKLCSKSLRFFVFCLDGFHFLLRFLACFLLGNFNFLRALFSFSASLCALPAGGNLPLHFLLRFLLHFLLQKAPILPYSDAEFEPLTLWWLLR